jgi:flagellar basal-body rod protein FlgG
MYSAAAGMAAQQQRLDAVANDLANTETTGYKKLRVAFRDLVYTPSGPGSVAGVQEGAGAAASLLGRGMAQGPLQRTERALDVALQGPGFVRVTRADGTQALTRDGALRFDDQGRLVTERGELTGVAVPAGTSEDDVTFGRDGSVSVNGREVGRLDLVDVRAPAGLQALGDNGFAITAASGPATPAGAGTSLIQGALEASNVDVAEAFTEMIEAQRAFELASRAIKMQDEIAGIANGVKR